MSVDIPRADFERLVEQALDELPERFQELLENVVVVVEEEPRRDDYLDNDIPDDDDELLGIFRGIPRTHATFDMPPMLPNRIAIFRGPILRVSASRREAKREIRDTVIHELGHYFGLDDEGMVY